MGAKKVEGGSRMAGEAMSAPPVPDRAAAEKSFERRQQKMQGRARVEESGRVTREQVQRKSPLGWVRTQVEPERTEVQGIQGWADAETAERKASEIEQAKAQVTRTNYPG